MVDGLAMMFHPHSLGIIFLIIREAGPGGG